MQAGRNGRGGVSGAPMSRGAFVTALVAGLGAGVVPGGGGGVVASANGTVPPNAYSSVFLTNKATRDLYFGEVVAISAVDPLAVSFSDTIFTRQIFVVVIDTVVPVGLTGEFVLQGDVLVKTNETIALGEYVQKGTAAGVGRTGRFRIGQTPNLSPPHGALGHATRASADGFVRCFWYGVSEPAFTIANLHEFYEDFETYDLAALAAGQLEKWKYGWHRQSNADVNADYGVMRVQGDGATVPHFRLARAGSILVTPFNLATHAFIVLEMRFAQRGAAAGTRRLGLGGTAIANADPANGLFVRFALNGTIFAVFRAAGAETAVDCGITAATDSMDTVTMIVDGAGFGYVLQNGQRVGDPVTTNIPIVALGPSGGNSVATLNNGFDVDAIRVLAPRSPFS